MALLSIREKRNLHRSRMSKRLRRVMENLFSGCIHRVFERSLLSRRRRLHSEAKGSIGGIRQNWGELGGGRRWIRSESGVRFIELEQQAAIRHNSIISFFRTFLPSSSSRYDSSRCSRIHVHQYPTVAGDDFTLAFSLSSSRILPSWTEKIENSKSQIPNISLSGAVLYASGIFFGRDSVYLCVRSLSKIQFAQGMSRKHLGKDSLTTRLCRVSIRVYTYI